MSNLVMYDNIFMDSFDVSKEELPSLSYHSIEAWDSIGHMQLITSLEEAFHIRLKTEDILNMHSYEKGKEILANYGVEL